MSLSQHSRTTFKPDFTYIFLSVRAVSKNTVWVGWPCKTIVLWFEPCSCPLWIFSKNVWRQTPEMLVKNNFHTLDKLVICVTAYIILKLVILIVNHRGLASKYVWCKFRLIMDKAHFVKLKQNASKEILVSELKIIPWQNNMLRCVHRFNIFFDSK